MSFHRTILGVCTAVFATVFASAAFAQCCGGIAVAPVCRLSAVPGCLASAARCGART